jgi:uncharacterized integral membrane protein
MDAGKWVVGLIGVLVAVLVGLALFDPIQEETADANVTAGSAEEALLGIIPLMVIVGILLAVVFWAVSAYRHAEG